MADTAWGDAWGDSWGDAWNSNPVASPTVSGGILPFVVFDPQQNPVKDPHKSGEDKA